MYILFHSEKNVETAFRLILLVQIYLSKVMSVSNPYIMSFDSKNVYNLDLHIM